MSRWVGDLVAILLSSLHEALQPLAKRRAQKRVRALTDCTRFKQQIFRRTIDMLREQGGLPSVDGEWLTLHVARQVVEQLIDLAREHWSCGKRVRPSTWEWTGFWLKENERDDIVADAVQGYLAAERPISGPSYQRWDEAGPKAWFWNTAAC